MLINEIFHGILGESTLAGGRAAIVRLTGCNLRCTYCDTTYAWEEGVEMTIPAILAAVRAWNPSHVLVTGGEPLCQADIVPLLDALRGAGYFVLLETNGSRDISVVPPAVMKVLDFKCPGSGHSDANRFENAGFLDAKDNVKFVLTSRTDYEWARGVADCYRLAERCPVLFSPAHGILAAAELARWMLDDKLAARLHLQLHKIVWGADRRGV